MAERKFNETKTDLEIFEGGCDIKLSKKIKGKTVRESLTEVIVKTLDKELINQDKLVEDISRWNKMFRGLRKKKSWPFEGASNAAIPITRALIETIIVRVFDVIWGQKKLAIVRGKSEEWQELAPQIEDALEWWQKNVAKLKKNLYSPMMQSGKIGTGVAKIDYERKKRTVPRYTTKKEMNAIIKDDPSRKNRFVKAENGQLLYKDTATVYEGPTVKGVPREDIFVSSDATTFEDAFMVGMRTYVHPSMFAARVKSKLYKVKDEVEEAILQGDELDQTKEDRIVDADKDIDAWDGNRIALWDLHFTYDVDGDGEPDDIVVTFHRRTMTILRAYYNPYFYGYRPFQRLIGRPIEYSFDGEGGCQILEKCQVEVDALHNQRIDRGTQLNAPVWKRRRGSFQGDQKIFPGAILDFNNPETDLMLESGHSAYPDTAAAEASVIQYMHMAIGATQNVMGQSTAERPVARETLALIQEANKLFKFLIDNYRDDITELLYRAIEMMAQYSPTYRYETTKGGKKEQKMLDFPYGIIRDGIEIELMASSEVMNTEVRREINLIVYQLLSSYSTQLAGMGEMLMNPMVQDSFKRFILSVGEMGHKLMIRILRDFGIVDAESLVPSLDMVDPDEPPKQPPPPPPGQGPPPGGGPGAPPQGPPGPQGPPPPAGPM